MGGPEWVRWLCAALFAAVTAACLARLVARSRGPGPSRLPDDLAQAVMGLGMIGMVLAGVRAVPEPVWLAVFGGQALGFGVALLRGACRQDPLAYTHHLMAGAAMTYMAVAGATSGPLGGPFGVYFLVQAVWSARRAVTAADGGESLLHRPRVVEGCRALMGGGMAYVLLAM